MGTIFKAFKKSQPNFNIGRDDLESKQNENFLESGVKDNFDSSIKNVYKRKYFPEEYQIKANERKS